MPVIYHGVSCTELLMYVCLALMGLMQRAAHASLKLLGWYCGLSSRVCQLIKAFKSAAEGTIRSSGIIICKEELLVSEICA